MASDIEPDRAASVLSAANELSYHQYTFRCHAEITRFFSGLGRKP